MGSPYGQSRLASLTEAVVNISVGFFVSLAVWTLVVVPLWDLKISMRDNLQITALFTVVSIARSYVWRRVFNYLSVRT